MRILKFRIWDGFRITTCGGMFNNTTGTIEVPKGSIVMQFTGLHDKNGKEIYEGDIVAHGVYKWNQKTMKHDIFDKHTDFGVVCLDWEKWGTHSMGGDFYTSMYGWMVDKGCGKEPLSIYLEVIGNIYENPELIKEQL